MRDRCRRLGGGRRFGITTDSLHHRPPQFHSSSEEEEEQKQEEEQEQEQQEEEEEEEKAEEDWRSKRGGGENVEKMTEVSMNRFDFVRIGRGWCRASAPSLPFHRAPRLNSPSPCFVTDLAHKQPLSGLLPRWLGKTAGLFYVCTRCFLITSSPLPVHKIKSSRSLTGGARQLLCASGAVHFHGKTFPN